MINLISSLLLLPLVACSVTPSRAALDAEIKRLCANDGGIKVYETVGLAAEKFDLWGNVHIPSKSKSPNSDKYLYEREYINLVADDPQMNKTIHKIIRRSDGKILGTSTWYSRGGGNPPGPWHPSSFICPAISKDAPSLESAVFIKEDTK